MTYKGKRTTENYRGTVSLVERKNVRVLLDTPNGEVVVDLDRKYFPKGRITVGYVFDYSATISIKPVPKRVPSDRALAKMRKELEEILPKDLDV